MQNQDSANKAQCACKGKTRDDCQKDETCIWRNVAGIECTNTIGVSFALFPVPFDAYGFEGSVKTCTKDFGGAVVRAMFGMAKTDEAPPPAEAEGANEDLQEKLCDTTKHPDCVMPVSPLECVGRSAAPLAHGCSGLGTDWH